MYSETLTESYFALLVWDKKAIEVQSFPELASKYSYILKVTMSSAADVPYQMVQPTTGKRVALKCFIGKTSVCQLLDN